MIYSVGGVRSNSNRITHQKSIEYGYTFEKDLIKNKDNNYVKELRKIENNLSQNNCRRIDKYPSHIRFDKDEPIDSNNDQHYDEIVKYIDRIISIASNETKYDDNYNLNFTDLSNYKTENLTLNRLLSLRLCEISRIKDLYLNNVTESSKRVVQKRRNEPFGVQYYAKKPVLNLSEARNDSSLLNLCLKNLRWKGCNYNAGDIIWLGFSVSFNQMLDFISINKRVNYGRMMINRYPNMSEITKKGHFYDILDQYSAYLGGNECFPRSFKLPEDLERVLSSLDKHVPLIFKPANGSMGQGVRVVTTHYDISDDLLADYTAQEYISSPLLLSGKKFDIRVYLLLIGESRAFIYKNSLVRICTEQYEYPSPSNSKNNFIHLTNYSINKSNTSSYHRGEPDDEKNNKRLLNSVLDNIEQMGYQREHIWSQIVNICSLVCGTLYPEIHLNARLTSSKSKRLRMPGCFQILGLDVIIDNYGKAWLLEVNSCPSLKTSYFDGNNFREDSVDLRIKLPLVTGALRLVHMHENSQKLRFNHHGDGIWNIFDGNSEKNEVSDQYTAVNGSIADNMNNVNQPTTSVNRGDKNDKLKPEITNNSKNNNEKIELEDEWEEIIIRKSKKLNNLMALFIVAKSNSWETTSVSKREWVAFCESTAILEMAELIVIIETILKKNAEESKNKTNQANRESRDVANIENKISKDENWIEELVKNTEFKSGKKLISQMFSETVGRHGSHEDRRISFPNFVYILNAISNIIEKYILKINKKLIKSICKSRNLRIDFDELEWKAEQPHNHPKDLKFQVADGFIKFLIYNVNKPEPAVK